MGRFRIQTHQIAMRNAEGEFLAEVESGLAGGIQELGHEAAEVARAVVLANLRTRTGTLLGGIEAEILSATSIRISSDAPWSAHQEFGTGRHPIGTTKGSLGPNPYTGFYLRNPDYPAYFEVDHPGHGGVGFMRSSYEWAVATGKSTIESHLP